MPIKKTRKIFTSQVFLLFIIIFFASAIFRITNLDLIEFKADEAINLLLASRPLFGHSFTPGGTVSSVGILNPPFFNYIIFPFTFLTLDPRGISFFIGFINSLAIAFFCLVIRRYYGTTIAFITTILLALSPWAILYSRKIWTQDLLFPFFILLFLSIHKLVVEKKMFYWLVYTASSLFLIQLHQTAVIFIAILTIFLLFKKVKIDCKYLLIGIAIGILPLVPYFLFEINNGCPDCQSLIQTKEKLTIYYKEVFLRPFQIVGFGNLRFLIGNDTLTLTQKFPFLDNLRKILYLQYFFLPLGFLLFVKKFKELKFMAFAVLLLPVLYFFLKIEPFMHYYIIAMPILFLFLGIFFGHFVEKRNQFLKISSLFLLFIILIASATSNVIFYNLLRTQEHFDGDYGSTFFSSDKKLKTKFKNFENQKDYTEILLAGKIPLDYVFGFKPLGKILYPSSNKNEIKKSEQKLKKGSKDPRIEQQIISFYTKNPPNLETIDILRKKNTDIPQFKNIYKTVLDEYLSKNFKKEYIYNERKLRFFYPEHWKAEKILDKVIVSGDGYSLSISKNGHTDFSHETAVLNEITKSIRPL